MAAVRIGLRCPGDLRFDKLSLSSLRFYLNGESNLIHTLYELLCNNCSHIVIRDTSPKSKAQPVILSADALKPVGFGEHDGMLPYAAAVVHGLPVVAGVLLFPAEVLLPGSDRARADLRGGVRRTGGDPADDFAV